VTPASSIVKKVIGRSPDRGYAAAPRLAAHVQEKPPERTSKVNAISRRHGKLACGARSWLYGHLLLGGSGDGPWDYRFLEDDYRRRARRP